MTYNKAAFDGDISLASVRGQVVAFPMGPANDAPSASASAKGLVSAFAKRAFDIAFVVALAPIALPIIALCAAKIRKDGGPAFFGHTRVGQHGENFKCWKLRSMVPNAEERLRDLLAADPEARFEFETTFKLKNDPRITRIGNFLRKSSLDELPQLWNILIGEMSVVGPRPVTRKEVEHYGEHKSAYLSCRPGLTGFWQVNGRNDVSFAERVAMDAEYCENQNLWLDIKICLKTALVVLKKTGV